MKNNRIILLFIFLFCTSLFSQNNFQFYRDVIPAKDGWNTIELNDSVTSFLFNNINGIRIYQLNTNDTMEIPYIFRYENDKGIENMVKTEILNAGYTKEGFEYLINQNANNVTNVISILLNNKNFDYAVKLDGSNDLKNWTTIGDNFRIVDIKIDQNSFHSNTIIFPACNFQYYKIIIKNAKNILLNNTVLKIREIKNGNYQLISSKIKSQFNKNDKKSTHSITFTIPTVISSIQAKINYQGDFLRNFKIFILKDSIKTKKGNVARWEFLANSQFSSLHTNDISFPPIIVKGLKIEVEEMDNPPLNVDSVFIKKPVVSLLAQLNIEKSYALYYGNEKAAKPNYDIENFSSTIPSELPKAKLLSEVKIILQHKSPLLTNKVWLWVVLSFIIIILGYFTLKMLKKP